MKHKKQDLPSRCKSEKEIEAAVTDYARSTGYIPIRFTPRGDRGWPDHIYAGPHGLTVWIEFKAPGKKPTKIQVYRINQLLNMGHVAGWFDNEKTACEFLDAARLSAARDAFNANSSERRFTPGS